MTKHVVFGAGLIGCYLGASIQSRGQSVDFIGRASIGAKLSQGILISDYLGNETQLNSIRFNSPDNQENKANIDECDYLWLTVKCTAIEQAVAQIKPYVKPSTVILCCQNGLGSESLIKKAFPDNPIRRVMVPFNVVEMKPGHFHRGSEGNLTIESLPNSQSIDNKLLNLSSDNMSIVMSSSMSELLWAKLQLNLSNAVNALADVPVKEMLEDRDFRKVIALLMSELLMVVQKEGIAIPKVTALPGRFIPKILKLPTIVFRAVAKKMLAIDPNVRTSMWWDISQNKLTEIDHLNGAVVDAAKRLDIEAPCNQRIVDLIKKVEVNKAKKGITGADLLNYVQGH
jgi:2-dehydropantoate 2-reductase